MTDRSDMDELHLPPELAELDAELRSITYEERPSFAPELEAELEREWGRLRRRPRLPVRQLLAAGVAGLLMVALGVPSARGSLVRLLETLQSPEPVSVTPPLPAGGPLFYELPATEVEGEDDFSTPSAVPAAPLPVPTPRPGAAPPSDYVGPEATLPLLHDRDRLQAVIAENYPRDLQAAGIGGTVRLLLWVDSTGVVDLVHLGRTSGEEGLDQAALEVAPTFRFEPAQRWGRPVGTWVEFDMVFEPRPTAERGEDGPLPRVRPVDEPSDPASAARPPVAEWSGDPVLPSPVRREAEELLRAALDDDRTVSRLGPLESILQGNPPPGEAPTAWRSEVTRALEEALVRDPDNPAPLLALARIRRKQGLRDQARVLVERGLERAARRTEAVGPTLRAELHHERGTLLRERWTAVKDGGWIPAEELDAGCPAARSAHTQAATPRASVERLIAWNYLCPAQLGSLFQAAFRADTASESGARRSMLAAFGAAVGAWPAHAGANVELLLAHADDGDWGALVEGGERFLSADPDHPHGLLLSALGLQRLGRPAAAESRIRAALDALPAEAAEGLQEIRPLLTSEEAAEYGALGREDRARWRSDFWRGLDPILGTPVNERWVEHLARAAYAHLRLGGVGTDAGRIWIRYGEPDEIRALDEGAGLRTEFWDYGQGPDLTFRRLSSTGSTSLTAEGRAYAEELVDVFPHRYGPLGREVLALSGDLTRFRGEDRGAVDLELRVPLPPVVAPADADSLEVELFLLDERSDKLSRTRRSVSASEEAVFFRLSAPSEAREVVVEFHDPASGRAASFRESVVLETVRGAPGISDLALTRRAVVDRDAVARGAEWLRPLSLAEPVDAPVVGAFFELYEMQEATSWYQLRAEAESLETGQRYPVPVRPAGEDGYRGRWDRVAEEPGVTAEFLGLALGNLPRGRYAVRVVVEFPLAGGPLVAERTVTLD